MGQVPRDVPATPASPDRDPRRALELLQEVTRALSRRGMDGVVGTLSARLALGAALLDPEWRILVSAGWDDLDADVVRDLIERRPGQAQSLATPQGRLELQPLGPRPASPGGWLALRSAEPLDPTQRLVVQHAVAVVSVALTRGDDFPGSPLGSAVLRTLLDRRPDVTAVLSGMGLDPRGRFVLLAVRADDPHDLARATGLARRTTPAVVGEVGATLVLVAADQAEGLAARMARTAAVVTSRPTDLAGLAAEAAGVVAAVREADPRAGRPYHLGEASAVTAAQPHLDRALEVTARTWLARLREHDAAHDSALVATVTAYLRRHGRLDPAARDLGIHRHTVKARLATVEEISGVDLDDPTHRALLVLALP